MEGALLALGLLAIAIVVALYVPALLTRKAMVEVVRQFYRKNAIEAEDAKNLADLGLSPPSLMQRIAKPRDYKPHALRLLRQIGAVQVTEEGKFYMVEGKLHESLRREKVL